MTGAVIRVMPSITTPAITDLLDADRVGRIDIEETGDNGEELLEEVLRSFGIMIVVVVMTLVVVGSSSWRVLVVTWMLIWSKYTRCRVRSKIDSSVILSV